MKGQKRAIDQNTIKSIRALIKAGRLRRVDESLYRLHCMGLTQKEIGQQVGRCKQTIHLRLCKITRYVLRVNSPGPYGMLSVRAYNCLHDRGVKSLAQAKTMSELELLSIRGVGPKTLKEILDA